MHRPLVEEAQDQRIDASFYKLHVVAALEVGPADRLAPPRGRVPLAHRPAAANSRVDPGLDIVPFHHVGDDGRRGLPGHVLDALAQRRVDEAFDDDEAVLCAEGSALRRWCTASVSGSGAGPLKDSFSAAVST
eukprot:COSAG06_NODE_15593_length_1059_cov_1.981250_1_plen_133_part_00